MSGHLEDRYADRLSEYLDGELARRERIEIEHHLETCAACRGVLDDLRAVSLEAAALADTAPDTDLWPAIASRLEPHTATGGLRAWLSGRQFVFSLSQLATAATLVVVLSGGAVWVAMRGAPRAGSGASGTIATTTPAGTQQQTAGREPLATRQRGLVASPGDANGTDQVTVGSGASDARLASYDMTRYDATITELQDVIRAHRAELDTSTVRIIEQNLSLIDHAIGDARRALNADPANSYLNGHLAQQLQRKVRLLQQATDLVAVRQS